MPWAARIDSALPATPLVSLNDVPAASDTGTLEISAPLYVKAVAAVDKQSKATTRWKIIMFTQVLGSRREEREGGG